MSRARLVLIAHGSTRASWRAPLEALRDRLTARLGGDAVRLAFMELCPPDLATVVDEAITDGIDAIRVLPLFMSAGGHVTHDIAPTVDTLRAKHPALTIDLLPALGEHPRVLDALCEIAVESGATTQKPG